MQKFLSIDWNPPLQDIIDERFVSEERLGNECIIYKNFIGLFKNPFDDMDDDYDIAGQNLLNETRTALKPRQYVPGILKLKNNFPRRSRLSKQQHAMCLKVLLQFSEANKPKLTAKEKEELQKYLDLRPIINEEQEEFLEVAKKQWQSRKINLLHEHFITANWQSKLQDLHSLPRFYMEVTNVPLVGNKPLTVKFLRNCLQKGKLLFIKMPDLSSRFKLLMRPQLLTSRFDPTKRSRNKVSDDPDCHKLAEENNVDVVISSSGLNCLINNVGPKFQNSWVLPIVIKKHENKNIVYINKPTTIGARTIPETNTWVYKYVLRYTFRPEDQDNTNASYVQENDQIFDDVDSDALLKLEDDYEQRYKSTGKLRFVTKTEHIDASHESVRSMDKNSSSVTASGKNQEDKAFNGVDKTSGKQDTSQKDANNGSSKFVDQHVAYRLFTIGPENAKQNELMKDNSTVKTFTLLVRTKTDGYEMTEDGHMQQLVLAPKLEHQLDLGAEVVTLEEALKQWVSLVFRPGAYLARVRSTVNFPEVIQIERRTTRSLSTEIKRLYNLKVEETLAIFHNISQHLTNLGPGNYIMVHTVKTGAFATVYKETNFQGKSALDLHTLCNPKYVTQPETPWIMIDKSVVTPALKYFERMPAMFFPHSTVQKKKPFVFKQDPVKKGLY